jgi:hypothetical protein
MYRYAAAGGGDVVDRDHACHDFARQWQTPESGERVMDELMAPDTAAGDRMRIAQDYRLRLGG